MDLAALKTEISTDPAALGYAALYNASNWPGVVALINDTTKGGQISVVTVDARLLMNAVVPSEYSALTQAQRDLWRDIIVAAGVNGVRVNDAGIVALVLSIWASGTTTRANLAALQKRAGSRAEALWGIGTVVGYVDVMNACFNADGTRSF